MKTSEALKRTKENLWDGDGDHPCVCTRKGKAAPICYAAAIAGKDVYDIVQPIISRLLGGSALLGEWLWRHHRINTYGLPKQYQATRHAWLDHLIAHYESLGD